MARVDHEVVTDSSVRYDDEYVPAGRALVHHHPDRALHGERHARAEDLSRRNRAGASEYGWHGLGLRNERAKESVCCRLAAAPPGERECPPVVIVASIVDGARSVKETVSLGSRPQHACPEDQQVRTTPGGEVAHTLLGHRAAWSFRRFPTTS